MDYGKSGNPKASKAAPKFDAHSRHGTGAPKKSGQADKAELLARMKAAAEAKTGRDTGNPKG